MSMNQTGMPKESMMTLNSLRSWREPKLATIFELSETVDSRSTSGSTCQRESDSDVFSSQEDTLEVSPKSTTEVLSKINAVLKELQEEIGHASNRERVHQPPPRSTCSNSSGAMKSSYFQDSAVGPPEFEIYCSEWDWEVTEAELVFKNEDMGLTLSHEGPGAKLDEVGRPPTISTPLSPTEATKSSSSSLAPVTHRDSWCSIPRTVVLADRVSGAISGTEDAKDLLDACVVQAAVEKQGPLDIKHETSRKSLPTSSSALTMLAHQKQAEGNDVSFSVPFTKSILDDIWVGTLVSSRSFRWTPCSNSTSHLPQVPSWARTFVAPPPLVSRSLPLPAQLLQPLDCNAAAVADCTPGVQSTPSISTKIWAQPIPSQNNLSCRCQSHCLSTCGGPSWQLDSSAWACGAVVATHSKPQPRLAHLDWASLLLPEPATLQTATQSTITGRTTNGPIPARGEEKHVHDTVDCSRDSIDHDVDAVSFPPQNLGIKLSRSLSVPAKLHRVPKVLVNRRTSPRTFNVGVRTPPSPPLLTRRVHCCTGCGPTPIVSMSPLTAHLNACVHEDQLT